MVLNIGGRLKIIVQKINAIGLSMIVSLVAAHRERVIDGSAPNAGKDFQV
jgi:hypothetical protein